MNNYEILEDIKERIKDSLFSDTVENRNLEYMIAYIQIIEILITDFRKYAKEKDLLNTQEYIEYENVLNDYSCKDPND